MFCGSGSSVHLAGLSYAANFRRQAQAWDSYITLLRHNCANFIRAALLSSLTDVHGGEFQLVLSRVIQPENNRPGDCFLSTYLLPLFNFKSSCQDTRYRAG